MAAIFVKHFQKHVHDAFKLAVQHPLELGQQHAFPSQLLGLHKHKRRDGISLGAEVSRQVKRVINRKGDFGKLRSIELLIVVASVRPPVEANRR